MSNPATTLNQADTGTPQARQASVLAVFGFTSITTAARHHQGRWDAEHPNEPLDTQAVIHGIWADMNASLPEPFTIENPESAYINGPDHPALPTGPGTPARTTFQSMDLHLETYTLANVTAWHEAGNDGYPWPPPATQR